MRSYVRIALFALVVVLGVSVASVAMAAPVLRPGLGWPDGPHTSYPGLCTGCHTFQVWPPPAILEGATPAHGPRGTTCSQCHVVNVPPPADILAPTAAAADISGSAITVSWLPVSGAASYRVYRATSPTGTFAHVGTTAGLTFSNTGCSAGVTYYYKVRGVDAAGLLGPLCAPLSARTTPSAAIRVDSSLSQMSAVGTGWKTITGTRYVGGSTRSSAVAGNKITVPFRGTAVTWYGTRGKAFGKAAVYVDGALVKTVDTYYASTLYDRALFTKTGLADKAHTLMIVVSKSKNIRATGRRIDVDSFKFTGTTPGLNQEETKATFAGTWTAQTGTSYSGSAARLSTESTASVTYSFRGTGVTCLSTKGATRGKAAVFIDGVQKGTIDTWAGATAYRRPVFTISGLTKANHTLRVVPMGSCGPVSTGNGIDVDAFVTR